MASSNPFEAYPRPTQTYRREGYAATSPSRPELSLKGKTVLITGGASGIGLATSRAFAEAGTSILAIIARNETSLADAKKELEAAHPSTKVLTFSASVTDTAQINDIVARLGTIDVLVLNAAVLHKPMPLLDIDPKIVEESFQTNVIAPLNLIRAFVSLPPRTEGAERTVILTSTAGVHMTSPGVSVYAASKMAITQLTASLAADYGDKGIRAFSFHPALAWTPGAKSMGYPEDFPLWDDKSLPAQHAVWLCSPEANFLKGRFVWAHWDVEELMAKKKLIEENPTELTMTLLQDKVLA